MKIKVFLEDKNEHTTVELKEPATVQTLLQKLNLNPVTVVVSKNNTIVTEDAKITEKDKIEVFAVISGG